MSRIVIATLITIVGFTALLVAPVITKSFIGDDIYLHVDLIFKLAPAMLLALFVGVFIEGLLDR